MNNEEIKTVIEELLDRMTVRFDSINFSEGELEGYVRFDIQTDNSGILIGKDGKHLQAFSLVVRKMLENKNPDTELPKFFVDVGGYQSEKIKNIQGIAKTMAERAVSFKRNVALDPMSPYERLIVHSVLSNMRDVETESEGTGKQRYVVIKFIDRPAADIDTHW